MLQIENVYDTNYFSLGNLSYMEEIQ